MSRPLRVLIVEDRPPDVELMVRELRGAGLETEWESVDTEAGFVSGLDPPPDVILCDYSLPAFSARRALEILDERGAGIPFIVVSGTVGEDAAVEMMRRGADDYLLKDRLARLGEAIRNALERRRLLREKEEATRALEDREARLRDLLNQTSAVLWTVDQGLRVTSSMGARLDVFGLRPEQLVGTSLEEYFGASDVAPVAIGAHQRALSGRSASYEDVRNGGVYEARLDPLREPRGKIVGVVGVAVDVTRLKQAEERARRALEELRETDQIRRRLLSRLLRAQEEERQAIAGDIHDDSIQVMSAVGMELGALRAAADAKITQRLEDLEQVVGDSISRLRRLMFELSPPALSREGLCAALQEHLQELEERHGIVTRLEGGLPQEPSMEARTIVYRIAREALTNVRKHARARRVEVRLEAAEGGVQIRIRDDGSGFRAVVANESANGHLGLISMKERAEMAGGWWRVDTAPDRGTTVEFWVPGRAGE